MTVRFTECELCFQFKEGIAKARSMEIKLGELVKYRSHLASEYSDRAITWALQELGSDPLGDLLVVQVDGMDQGKFRLPRDPKLKSTASLAKFVRPRLKVHGVWLFGYSLELFVMDEPTRHDASCITECIARGIERVSEICHRLGRRVPSKLVILGDNTVRELKNQINLGYASRLCALRKMRICMIMFLRKSHTHDRIDQVWGILARRKANTDCLLDPTDTMHCIQSELQRPGLRSFLGSSCEIHVQKLDSVRDWKSQWERHGISLSGGLLDDASANHSFMMFQRKGSKFHTMLNSGPYVKNGGPYVKKQNKYYSYRGFPAKSSEASQPFSFPNTAHCLPPETCLKHWPTM